METVFALCAILLLAFNLLGIGLAGWRLRRRDTENALVRQKPPVSIVVPLRGVENFTSLTLSRAFELDWPDYELLFCIADEFDPVIEEVRRTSAAFPAVSAQVLLGDDRISANPKLNNCVKGWRAARHEWVILADSNVLMPKSYIATMMSAWRPDSGLVCSPPLGSRPAGFWAHVECAFLNGSQGRWQYAAEAIGIGFAQGKSMLWNKPFLEDHGGIRALAAEIAEDAASTKLVRNAGRRVHLVSPPFEQPLGQRHPSEIWSRQTRWARLRRVTFPQYFAPEILTGALPPLLLALAAAAMMDINAVITAFAVLAIMYAPELVLAALNGWPLSLYTLPAMIARDMIMPVVWTRSWIGSAVAWRGNVMTIGTAESTLAGPSAD
ncbi:MULTISPECIES: ceramide glucosyltransferase [Rhizobium/Agrobacterium group]|uniref:ceramide glucosyltransferase n=1 Tax=Rhizobium/Agrobacterium group TaxID=227290 RepID=UPI002300D420|nr:MULTISPECIES: ceramide glucosyltransferase [Rhizobium/Agrobacterium group]MDA5635775.1 ceramide glucosyltransferase [Agrobacterium sp. ST15.16.024]MDF1891540.1 ceramide glucosyltransferase [Rhizobium rhizogenes]